ncbi:MAG: hypothetical protein HOV81_04180 [Kofleriaceae bacterium]|nr:hypothetical protein [Kofleriaceae bacterium]
MAEPRVFRFKPRYRGIAISALGIGGALGVVSIAALGAALLPLATGAAGVVLGAAYLMSPSWKLEVAIDDDALEVRTPKATKFRVPWTDVVRVVASPTTNTCFVDGGAPERSLLVPGDGAPAPYDIEDRPALVAAILAHVPADKVQTVDTLDAARKA